MKFLLNTKDLLKGLNIVKAAIVSNPVVPICECIKVEAKNNKIILTTTNLNHSIITSLDAEVSKPGVILLSFLEVHNFINSLPDNLPVVFETDGTRCLINSGKFNASISKQDQPKDFPRVDQVSDIISSFDFSYAELSKIKDCVSPFSSTDGLTALSGILFEFEETKMNVVSCNKHIIAKLTYDKVSSPGQFLVDRSFIKSLTCFKKEDEITFKFDSRFLQIESTDTIFIVRLLEEKYPDYKSAMPAFDKWFFFTKSEMLSIIKTGVLFSNLKTHQIHFDFEGDKILIKTEDLDFNREFQSEIAIEEEISELKMAFNGNYLMSGISAFEEETLVMQISSHNRPVYLRSKDTASNYFFMLCPVMRIDN